MPVKAPLLPGGSQLLGRPSRRALVKFGAIGVSGLAVNLAALAFFTSVLSIHYLIGAILATQASTVWNFCLSDRFVFAQGGGRLLYFQRYVQFAALNNSSLLARGPMLVIFTEWMGINYLVSNAISLGMFTVFRFVVSERLIWRPRRPEVAAPQPIRLEAASSEIEGRRSSTLSARVSWRWQHGMDIWRLARARLRAARTRLSSSLVSVQSSSIVGSAWPSYRVMTAGALAIAIPAIWFRMVALDAVGLNSDEIVYGGQGASISGDAVLIKYFPIFRAHPLLFQTTLSLVFRGGISGFAGRATAAAFGVATVAVVFLLARALYGNLVGMVSALLLAVMPYHVVVSRQILLDGPMVFFSTLGLYLLARYAESDRSLWLYSSAAVFGLMFITNERSIVLFGGVYGFMAMSAERSIPLRRLITSGVILFLVALPYPLSIKYSGRSSTGEQFLAWQLFRRANHTAGFYITTVPASLGFAILALAVAGFVLSRKRTWREALLLWWIAVPTGFFQLWNVKGYQYLLPIAPAVAILAGRTLGMLIVAGSKYRWSSVPRVVAVVVLAVSVLAPARTAWHLIDPARPADKFIAGTGGVPGGREAGVWVAENVPEGSTLMAIGPSMANIIQYYGDRKTYGLSVSSNPLHRNPVYEPVINPDLQLRSSEIQYLVWDSFSAGRSEFFSDKLMTFVERYHGRAVHTEFIKTGSGDGVDSIRPVIIIYEVRA